MKQRLADNFHWADLKKQGADGATDEEKYRELIRWAEKARGQNPEAFDKLTEWILDDSQWGEEKLEDNKKLLMQDVIARFKEQTAQFRECLSALKPSGIVNQPVFSALDRFEDELSGRPHAESLQEAAARMFSDFSVMTERGIREQIAGSKTGPTGTDSVEIFGYINYLKDCDAAVQWALFMPETVRRQQNGFQVQSFEYKTMPAMRFIGLKDESLPETEARRKCFDTLDLMKEYQSELEYDVLLIHHNGGGVDVAVPQVVFGRFMKPETPVPDGFVSFDFIPYNDGKPGVPYISQFAYAVFAGDDDAMHQREGFDSDAMYDVTRNIMLAQGVPIPYPDKYWVAEVFLNGYEKSSSAYMFSAEL